MFRSSTGLLGGIPCPDGSRCTLGNCPFAHSATMKRPRPESAPKETKEPQRAPPKKSRLLGPQEFPMAPSSHQQRVRFVNVLRDKLEEAGGTADPDATAVRLEANAARTCTAVTYPAQIRTLVRCISRGEYRDDAPSSGPDQTAELHAKMPGLILSETTLRKRGYVVDIPEPAPSVDGVFPPPEYELKCDRCQKAVRPSKLDGQCQFHLLRRQWAPNNGPRGGGLSSTYPCCGEPPSESPGCEVRSTHVFKLADPSELAAATTQFVPTPSFASAPLFAAGIDCEMVYTDRGMELVRLTVVDFDSGKCVLDRLVRPYGKILDLNTRFSGVSDLEAGVDIDGVHYDPVTFGEAHRLLFNYVNAATIIVGHGLENDLNTMRLVHTRVIDTAALFPAVRTRTWALRDLSWKYLSRRIQTGEHDSMEDALAAIDIVKVALLQGITGGEG